ncbi:thioredoxin domain-containing protein [Owenweeksia hongkongensis]|uniref:thioredoxin domain-containing protein n=1 Tax=Owenweeksia hongkongensis TaxID=253245 RepID=UPI003A9280AF
MNTNQLINETSPYLLQHAHNPVDWNPWGEEAFAKAEKENKLVIVSIGYSACHWCHVMEHQSFEDSAAAALMNEHFISIKVDREERPDVDQVYMTAVQLMTGHGGWPLNVITLPDGRPIWGGTYFPKDGWMRSLQSIVEVYHDDPEKVLEYAEKLTEGVVQSELVSPNETPSDYSKEEIDLLFKNWSKNFDKKEGGSAGAPKFPMPVGYEFLQEYASLTGNEEAMQQLNLTLRKMALGGIYDQVGGGFSRYSVDDEWKVPHFEKMLYDNGQLVSLYSRAYQKTKSPLYKNIVTQTIEWLERDMLGPDGEFYSALDADSEGEEGKYYVWPEVELKEIIGEVEWEDFTNYFDLKKGKWEGRIVLMRKDDSENTDSAKVKAWEQELLKVRAERVAPGLDDKSLTSWNALMITGLVDAYKAFGDSHYLGLAKKNGEWLLKNQVRKDGSLFHSYKKGKSSIDGLIEDYTFAIQGFLDLYEATFDVKYLDEANVWMKYAKANFEDEGTGLFFTRSKNSKQLIAKSMEVHDNVIPAANSVMAHNLFHLYHLTGNESYLAQSEKMVGQIDKVRLITYPESFSNWARVLLSFKYPFYEVAIVGNEADEKYMEWQKQFVPNVLIQGSWKESDLPLLENRFVKGSTMIYVCENRVCQLPVQEVGEALDLLLK